MWNYKITIQIQMPDEQPTERVIDFSFLYRLEENEQFFMRKFREPLYQEGLSETVYRIVKMELKGKDNDQVV